jgi:hypothetical protein
MRHRGNAKELWLELKQVLTQYVVRHDVVFGVENTNYVSSLKKAGREIA